MPTILTRSILTILIPGLVTICPWLLALVQHTKATLGLDEFPTLANALIFAAAAVCGSILESIGTRIEIRWDKEREAEHAVAFHWQAYLFRAVDKEPIAYRYLSRLVTTMYFELTMVIAAPSFLFGCGVLAALRFQAWGVVPIIASLAACVFAGLYLYKQAKDTHLVLCQTRASFSQYLNEHAANSKGDPG